jgi:DICT domain-containing protein
MPITFHRLFTAIKAAVSRDRRAVQGLYQEDPDSGIIAAELCSDRMPVYRPRVQTAEISPLSGSVLEEPHGNRPHN